ncbi:MAG: hypothetical protein ACREEM_18935, partial [Blastocatellia bacterium]
MQSASASRDQSLGAIAGSYAMALQMNEAQRQATTGLIAQNRDQQVVGILADRSFGQRQAGIQMNREERDLRISQAQQNVGTIVHRSADVGEHAVTGLAKLGGDSLPLLPATPSAMKIVTAVSEARTTFRSPTQVLTAESAPSALPARASLRSHFRSLLRQSFAGSFGSVAFHASSFAESCSTIFGLS